MQPVSTKPYLIRAIHEWCSDHGYTPYLVVAVKGHMQVPLEYVKNGEIVLNTSYNATRNFQIGNDLIHFSARFGGVSRDVVVPIGAVVSIFARENGEGMAFGPDDMHFVDEPVAPASPLHVVEEEVTDAPDDEPPPERPTPGSRPALRVVK